MLDNPYILFPTLGVITAVCAVVWNRWVLEELYKQQTADAEETQTILKPNWRKQ